MSWNYKYPSAENYDSEEEYEEEKKKRSNAFSELE